MILFYELATRVRKSLRASSARLEFDNRVQHELLGLTPGPEAKFRTPNLSPELRFASRAHILKASTEVLGTHV